VTPAAQLKPETLKVAKAPDIHSGATPSGHTVVKQYAHRLASVKKDR